MKVQVLVTLDIARSAAADKPLPADDVVRASALQAVRNALSHTEDNGFSHDLEHQTYVTIESVQPYDLNAVTSLWRCTECNHEVRLTFSQIADIGNPICGQPGCDNEDAEMELVDENAPEPTLVNTADLYAPENFPFWRKQVNAWNKFLLAGDCDLEDLGVAEDELQDAFKDKDTPHDFIERMIQKFDLIRPDIMEQRGKSTPECLYHKDSQL